MSITRINTNNLTGIFFVSLEGSSYRKSSAVSGVRGNSDLTRALELLEGFVHQHKVNHHRAIRIRRMFEHVTFLHAFSFKRFLGVDWRER